MDRNTNFEVIVVGGSYAGLSAAMSLGRAMRRTLVIDGGKPCNRFSPHAHNFLTQDGVSPVRIAALAKEQVLYYPTVTLMHGLVTTARREKEGFAVTAGDKVFTARKLLLATGVQDKLPEVDGISDCWGKSVLHCPYCHGYEVRKQETGILGNGEGAFQMAMIVSNWTDRLTLFTNGAADLSSEQISRLDWHNIAVIEDKLTSIMHDNGYIQGVRLQTGQVKRLAVLYARPAIQQHRGLPERLGCALTDTGHIRTDEGKRTTVEGIYAAGDNMSFMRSVPAAVAAGNAAGAFINHDLITENF